jgi:hypothetical protein
MARSKAVVDPYELICVSVIVAILVLAAITGFFLPPDSRTPELMAPSYCSLPVLAQQSGLQQLSTLRVPPWRWIAS